MLLVKESRNNMDKLLKSIKIFGVSIAMFIVISPAFPQSLTLTPKDTELVDQKEQKQAGGKITIDTYRFHSGSSKDEIVEFYEQMFSNDGFKESSQSAKDKRTMVFIKSDSIILLNFVSDFQDKKAIYYYIQVEKFPANTKVDEENINATSSTYSPQKNNALKGFNQQ